MNDRCKYYVIHGDPVALARARISKGRFYDSQKHLKLIWGLSVAKQHCDEPFFNAPVFMDVIFYMPIAKNLSLKKKQNLYDQWFISRPDNTNLAKFVEDAIETITYKDDCIIVKHSIEKVYDDGNGPRTEFILKELVGRRNHRELL